MTAATEALCRRVAARKIWFGPFQGFRSATPLADMGRRGAAKDYDRNIERIVSSVSASSGFLSVRQRDMRGKRTARPDLCLLDS
jgi:hypothetical protein